MARGTTLTVLLSMLKAEVGDSSATNTTLDARYTTLLSNKQKWFSTEFGWPFLERKWDVTVPAGQQFTAFPTLDDVGDNTTMVLEELPAVEVLWTIKWQPVLYGIGAAEYNTFNYQLNQQASDPIQRWRINSNVNETTGANKFEVWPVPVSAQTIRFTGQRALKALAIGTDTADLDDMLLVLSVAGDVLTKTKQPDAGAKLAYARNKFQQLRQGLPSRDERRCLGNPTNQRNNPRKVGMIITTH